MKLTKYDHSVNYTCTVIKLPTKQKVDGLDNLVRVEVFGNSCLVGKDSDPDDLYLFFPAESCLSETFLYKNNLYRECQLNANTGEKGFFEQSGRVKALKMRGVISSGFVIPASSLLDLFAQGDAHYIYSELKVGDEFNEIEGVEICRKYVSKNTITAALPGSKQAKQDKVNNKLKDLIVPNQFRFHSDTTHLAKNLHIFSKDDIILISDKWHGSSCILSKVLINKKLTWFQKLLNKLGGNILDKEFGYVYSSGKPKSNLPKGVLQLDEVQTFKSETGDCYTSNIWKKAFEDYKHTLEDGITIYSELVGFTEGGAAIQKGYDYGCGDGEYKMLVYRITYTKPDGSVIEFSWQQIKDYCKKYELDTVKELYFGNLPNWNSSNIEIGELMGYFLETLQTAYNMEKQDPYCTSKVPAEGLVVRIDGKPTYSAFKIKAKKFLAHETKDLDAGEVNMEDQG